MTSISMSPLAMTAMVIGYILTIAGGVTLVAKIWGRIKGMSDKIKAICDGQCCQLRNDITSIYYMHNDEERPTLKEYERKNLDDLYEGYKALGGNHYIDDIYGAMRGWIVKD